jgi:hypothetical protein
MTEPRTRDEGVGEIGLDVAGDVIRRARKGDGTDETAVDEHGEP